MARLRFKTDLYPSIYLESSAVETYSFNFVQDCAKKIIDFF